MFSKVDECVVGCECKNRDCDLDEQQEICNVNVSENRCGKNLPVILLRFLLTKILFTKKFYSLYIYTTGFYSLKNTEMVKLKGF